MTTVPNVKRRPLERGDLERMALPEDYWRVRLPGLPVAASAVVQNYLARMPELFKRGAGLALSGPLGTGKTSLASIVAREARMTGFSVYFTTVWDLREAVRTRGVFDQEQTVTDRCKTVDLLILDNLRPDDATDHFLGRRALDELLSLRAASMRPTVLTTAMTFPELDNPKGSWRGLLQLGRLVFVPVAGPNLREEALRSLRDLVVPSEALRGGPR